MKCIRYYPKHGGHVARLDDARAREEVAAGRAIFAPKHWLKAAKRAEAAGDIPDGYSAAAV